MKRSIFVVMMAVMSVGCAAKPTPPPQIPTQEIPVAPVHKTANEPDAFDKAGGVFADGSRYVWDEATQAYEWSQETLKTWYTEENKEKTQQALEEAKQTAEKAFNNLQNAIKDAVSNDKCKCIQGDPLCSCL